MKSLIVTVLWALVVLTTSRFAPGGQPPVENIPSLGFNVKAPNPLFNLRHLRSREINVKTEWEKALCKGAQLHMAMTKDENQAATYITPVRSYDDGDLVGTLKQWGYSELPGFGDPMCNFEEIKRAFDALQIDTRGHSRGGPNVCYHIEHTIPDDSENEPDPTGDWYEVNGKRMRYTDAYSTIGINPVSGVVYFLNRKSAAKAAHENWGVPEDQIKSEQLPEIRSSSDHAWSCWYRTKAGNNLADVNKIFSCMVTNEVTLALIHEALRTYELPPGMPEWRRPERVEKWPGTTFEMNSDAAKVMLGSPNGRATGFFLAQHKHRFGKNKSIEKITVFQSEDDTVPYILFWVIDAPNDPPGGDIVVGEHDGGVNATTNNQSESDKVGLGELNHTRLFDEAVVRRSADGKSFVREHVFHFQL